MGKINKLIVPAIALGVALFVPAGMASAMKIEIAGETSSVDSMEAALAQTVDYAGSDIPTITVEASDNLSGEIIVPAGAKATIMGGNNTFNGTFTFVADDSTKTTAVSIGNLVMDGGGTYAQAITSQNQATDPTKLSLIITDSTIKNYKNKGIYVTNTKNLTVTNTTFEGNATTDQTWYSGDYALDVNLIGIQGAYISIENNIFKGVSGGNAPIKVTQRGGSDDIMTDIPYYYKDGVATGNAAATINNLLISNNDFSGVTNKDGGIRLADVIIGSSQNADGTPRLSATNIPATVTAKDGTTTNLYVRNVAKSVETAAKEAAVAASASVITVSDSTAAVTGTVKISTSDEKGGQITEDTKTDDETDVTPAVDTTTDETVSNPQTGDNVATFLLSGIISIISLIGASLYIKES